MNTTVENEPVGKMYNPPHPGEVLQGLWLEPLGLSITKTAKILNVSRKKVSNIINAKVPLTGDMALRISIAFNVDIDILLGMQATYDAWHAEQKRNALTEEVTIVDWSYENEDDEKNRIKALAALQKIGNIMDMPPVEGDELEPVNVEKLKKLRVKMPNIGSNELVESLRKTRNAGYDD